MLLTYHLPDFYEYLSTHYYTVYQKYIGRLTELFPCSQSADNLVIADDDRTTQEENNYLLQLWKKYLG